MSNRVVVKLCDQCEEHWVPRAVVAISEDRAIRAVSEGGEYEVVLTAQAGWLIIKKVKNGWITAGPNIQDTGQDAHEVLATFLGSRNEDR